MPTATHDYLLIRDCSFFISISFYGPQRLLPLIVGPLTARWVAALIDKPLVYAGAYGIHKYLNGKTIVFNGEE